MMEINSRSMMYEFSSYVLPEISDFGKFVRIGEDDGYFKGLIDLYKYSATHAACVNTISQFIYGTGLKSSEQNSIEFAEFNRLVKPNTVKKIVFDKKLFGMRALEIITNAAGTAIVEVNHIPFDALRPSLKDKYNNINSWWYSPDFIKYGQISTLNYFDFKPIEIPVWEGEVGRPGRFIYVDSPYTVGNQYITPPDYEGAITEIETEREISIYHLTNVQTGFAGTTIVQFNNGMPTPEQRVKTEQDFYAKYAGTKGKKVVFLYNNGQDRAASIDTVQLSDADKQYQLLDERNSQKIFTAHRITSPMLLGVRSNAGLGSNADELRQAWEIMRALVIKPEQDDLIEFLEPIAKFNGYNLNLQIDAISPFTIMQPQGQVQQQAGSMADMDVDKPVNKTLTGMKGREFQNMNRIIRQFRKGVISQAQAKVLLKNGFGLNDDDINDMLQEEEVELSDITSVDWFVGLGEEIDAEQWKLVDELPIEGKPKEIRLGEPINLARVPSSQWKVTSEQDTTLFKVRYQYAGNPNAEREFCRKMMSAQRVYRKEDIEFASERQVNPGWGPRGSNTYDLWLYKGGGNCKHFWKRVIYMRRNNKKVSVNQAREMILALDTQDRSEAQWETNDRRVAQIPFDQNNRGFLPGNPQGTA